LCNEAIEADSTFAKPYLLMGDAAYRKKDFKLMAKAYKGLMNVCPDASEKAIYRLATYYFDTKKYEEAIPVYTTFLELSPSDTNAADDAEVKLFRAKAFLHPVDFKPVLVKGLSTPDPEYLPIISADNELCFFTRRFEYQSKNMLTSTSVEKFMLSHNLNGKWDTGTPMDLPFNKQNTGNEGGPTISLDNLHLFFTVNVKGNFDIYTSDLTPKGWSEPRSIGKANDPKFWDSQPSLSPDNKTLYFASFRDSVLQTSDIYVTKKNNGEWNSANPISGPINTSRNEKAPFMHPDGKTLYFSSDGHPGMGYDIYSFDMPVEARPEKMVLFKGQLKNDDNEVPDSARIEIRNISSKQVEQIDYDAYSGKYAGVLQANSEYLLTIQKDDYAFTSKLIDAAKVDSPAVTVELDLRKIKEGEAYSLNDILFETDSYQITDKSKAVIQDFAGFLKSNPKLKVAIYGHTDNSGKAEDNLLLSKNRAKAVYDYLIALGIEATRLSHNGFGQTKPVAANTTEKGKSLNRRTEFVVLKK